jgi:hypothetical protein
MDAVLDDSMFASCQNKGSAEDDDLKRESVAAERSGGTFSTSKDEEEIPLNVSLSGVIEDSGKSNEFDAPVIWGSPTVTQSEMKLVWGASLTGDKLVPHKRFACQYGVESISVGNRTQRRLPN